jgi:hypothetical protein
MTDTLTASSTPESGRKDSVDIQFLYWDECPSHERALEILQDVLETEDVPATVSILQIETDEDAETMRFPGSPTIRVNGADIQPTDEEDVVGLTCRAYQTPTGKISPLPPRDLIVEALHEAISETE